MWTNFLTTYINFSTILFTYISFPIKYFSLTNCFGLAKSFMSNYLGPIQIKLRLCIWQHYSQHTRSPRRGCSEQRRHVLTNSNGYHHSTRESLLDGYASYKFVTVEHMCARQRPCKHSPLYKGDFSSPQI